MSTTIRVSGLSGRYAARADPAIHGVDFVADAGQRVAVLGPNGGGKTTLFRALLGELPHVEGDVEVSGTVGYVPQTERARLDFPVSALDVALMGAYGATPWYRRLRASDHARARDALERVGLGASANRTFGELSGGQRQRVLIARALTQDADIFLLDEPFSGVDRASAEEIERLFGELAAQGRTLLVSTHDVEQARRADRLLSLNRAQVAYGPPAETLTVDVLRRTYGDELIVIAPGIQAVAVEHHQH